MSTHALVVSGITLFVALTVLIVVWRIRRAVARQEAVDTDQLSAAISDTWRSMAFDETVGRLETHARELKEFHRSVETMLEHPQERGAFGERQLEVIVEDHLPPDAYGLREPVVDGARPDCYIESASGRICIDAKFPLDNYRAAMEAEGDGRESHFRAFRDDVEDQLGKIATDYVRPAEGTAEVAFAFVPSEAVYSHLVREEYDLLREYTGRGVQVVSPLTLGHKLELIKADVQARQLSERAEDILDDLQRLADRFAQLDDEWGTLHRHVTNAKNKADDVDRAYESLRAEFDRIEAPGVDDAAD